jgi:hypothetical protein
VKRDDLAKVDLLPRIRHKALVTPELAPIFRGKEERLVETFATLTAVLDGHGYTSDSGTQGRRGYTGDYLFAWLGATTPLPTKVWRVMAQLGSRLFFYAMPDDEVTDAELDATWTGNPYRDRVAWCRTVAQEFLTARFHECEGVRGVKWDRERDTMAIRDRIKGLARLLAPLRGGVSVWDQVGPGDDQGFSPPNVEAPFRALAVLYNLARGRALLGGRRHLLPEDLDLLTHVALSSAPHERTRLVRALVAAGGTITTRQAATALKATPPTARRAMKALAVLGIGDLEGENDHGEGGILTLAPPWQSCLGLDIHTGADAFQPARREEVESETPVCVPSAPKGEEVDPWA